MGDGEIKCLVEELYPGNLLNLKWKVELGSNIFIEKRNKTKEELSKLVPEEIIRNIVITIKKEGTNEIVSTSSPRKNKEKITYHSLDQGKYGICVQYNGDKIDDQIFFSMKFNSVLMEEPNLL